MDDVEEGTRGDDVMLIVDSWSACVGIWVEVAFWYLEVFTVLAKLGDLFVSVKGSFVVRPIILVVCDFTIVVTPTVVESTAVCL